MIKNKRAIGQSDHPESQIVSVNDVSHNITETWWDNDTLLGKIEIITSPGFMKHGIISCKGDQIANLVRKGISIGISSRGLGSLKKEGDKNMVQDDFEIICWDIVTTPSTPGAWLFTDKNQISVFVESEEKDLSDKEILVGAMSKFLNLI